MCSVFSVKMVPKRYIRTFTGSGRSHHTSLGIGDVRGVHRLGREHGPVVGGAPVPVGLQPDLLHHVVDCVVLFAVRHHGHHLLPFVRHSQAPSRGNEVSHDRQLSCLFFTVVVVMQR